MRAYTIYVCTYVADVRTPRRGQNNLSEQKTEQQKKDEFLRTSFLVRPCVLYVKSQGHVRSKLNVFDSDQHAHTEQNISGKLASTRASTMM